MRTLYRDPEVVITDDVIAVRVPLWRRFRICDLRDPYVVILRARWPIGSRAYELYATHRDETICLVKTTDAAKFGQVRRALVRAFERERERQERRGMSNTERPAV